MKKNCFARFAAAALSLAMLAGCGGGASQSSDSAAEDTGSADSVELTVFAAASMTETLNQIAEDYKAVAPNATLTFNFASSGDLLTQIKEGADCDVFISAAPKQMNALAGSLKDDTDKNPDGLDELLDGTRIDPVSYTHLDVYKRQTISLPSAAVFASGFSENTGLPALIAARTGPLWN